MAPGPAQMGLKPSDGAKRLLIAPQLFLNRGMITPGMGNKLASRNLIAPAPRDILKKSAFGLQGLPEQEDRGYVRWHRDRQDHWQLVVQDTPLHFDSPGFDLHASH